MYIHTYIHYIYIYIYYIHTYITYITYMTPALDPKQGVHTIVCRKLCIAYNVSLIMYRIANYVSQIMYHKLCIAYHVSHIMYR